MDIYYINRGAPMQHTYHVEIKEHQDWHFATCNELDGLFVGHQSYDTVLRNIPECIQMMLEHERGEKVIVREEKAIMPTRLGRKTYVATTNKIAA